MKGKKTFYEEMWALEEKMSKDVEITCQKINAERRRKIEKKIYVEYKTINGKEKFINQLNVNVSMDKHIKNGSKITTCA